MTNDAYEACEQIAREAAATFDGDGNEADVWVALKIADAIRAHASVSGDGWNDIESAPTLDRLFVAGWRPRSGHTQGYWWFQEDATDEKGVPIDCPSALLWRSLPPAPKRPPPQIGSGRSLADATPNTPPPPKGS